MENRVFVTQIPCIGTYTFSEIKKPIYIPLPGSPVNDVFITEEFYKTIFVKLSYYLGGVITNESSSTLVTYLSCVQLLLMFQGSDKCWKKDVETTHTREKKKKMTSDSTNHAILTP